MGVILWAIGLAFFVLNVLFLAVSGIAWVILYITGTQLDPTFAHRYGDVAMVSFGIIVVYIVGWFIVSD